MIRHQMITCHSASINSLVIISPACVEIIRNIKTPSFRRKCVANFRSVTSSATGFDGCSLNTRKYFRINEIPCNCFFFFFLLVKLLWQNFLATIFSVTNRIIFSSNFINYFQLITVQLIFFYYLIFVKNMLYFNR